MNKTKVSQYIEDTFLSHADRYSATSMYVGEKIKNNEPTGELAVVYTVKEKKPVDQLNTDSKIPKSIMIDGEDVSTDVVEQDIEYYFESDLCHNINDENDMALINKNRSLARVGTITSPVRRTGMGLQNLTYSIEYKNVNGVHNMFRGIKIGTLGVFARDEQDGNLVGLSNNHVLTPNFVTANLQGSTSVNYKNNTVICPADDQNISGTSVTTGYMTMYERTVAADVEYKLGEVKRSWALQRLNNEIDAAICSVTIDLNSTETVLAIKATPGGDSDTSNSYIPVGMDIDYSMKWATSSEIDALVIGGESKLFKSGWASGPVGYPVSESGKTCELYMSGAYFTSFVSSKQFKNIIQYKGRNGLDPSAGGDSGSPLCAEINGEWKIIGIHFAGGQDRKTGEHHGLACRIDKIASKLKISQWDGLNTNRSAPNNFCNEVEPKYAVFNGWRNEPTIVIDGKTYYQMGRSSEDITHTMDQNGNISALYS